MADVDLADNTDDVLPLPALPSALFLHDVDELFSGEDDEPSPPASLKEQQPQRGGLRIQNVGGSLSFLLQVGSSPSYLLLFTLTPPSIFHARHTHPPISKIINGIVWNVFSN